MLAMTMDVQKLKRHKKKKRCVARCSSMRCEMKNSGLIDSGAGHPPGTLRYAMRCGGMVVRLACAQRVCNAIFAGVHKCMSV